MKKQRGRPKKASVEEVQVKEASQLFSHLQRCRASVSTGVIPADWGAVDVPMTFSRDDVPPLPAAGKEPSIDVVPPEVRVRLPSVTRILSETMAPESRAALDAWKERMISELGLDVFQKMQKGSVHLNVYPLFSFTFHLFF